MRLADEGGLEQRLHRPCRGFQRGGCEGGSGLGRQGLRSFPARRGEEGEDGKGAWLELDLGILRLWMSAVFALPMLSMTFVPDVVQPSLSCVL